MTLGTYGSTLLDELNRLANGGTYPSVNIYDEAGAARAWAERTDIPLTTTDTVGVLNEIAGLPRDQWLDYSGVCNYLAGTTNLPAAAALRQIAGDVQTPTPSEPLLLIATPGNQSVLLNWAPPANSGDAPVDNYRISVVDHPEIPAQETTTNPFNFTGLTNGTLYYFTIEAHNSFGWGPAATSPGATPIAPPKPTVTGGTFSSYGDYFYRAFTSTADLGVVNGPLEAEVLVIGGGGGGSYAAGGGAGGVLIQSVTLQPGNYTATVGAGGGVNSYYANPGSNSSFADIVALGGSGNSINGVPAYGGSGAGGMGADAQNGYGTPGQGFNGGNYAWYGGPNSAGGGGGGAGGPGANGDGNLVGGVGGQAIYLPDWANATGLGVNGYFAGGGGGSGRFGGASGGGGGAGNGGSSSSAAATALPNTGSGAGSRYGYQAGAGGSGVVIVRYLKTAVDFVPYSPTATEVRTLIWYPTPNTRGFCLSDGGFIPASVDTIIPQGVSIVSRTPNWSDNCIFPADENNLGYAYISYSYSYSCPQGGNYNPATNMCE